MTRLDQLREIVGGIRKTPLKPGPIAPSDLSRAADGSVIVRGKMDLRLFGHVGLTASGMSAIRDLAQMLRWNNKPLRRASTLDTLVTVIFDSVLEAFTDMNAAAITAEHLSQLERRVAEWSAAFNKTRLHLISCLIVPRECGSFSVGPVRFSHISEFDSRRRTWEPQNAEVIDHAYEQFLSEMAHAGAHYLAEVKVPGRELQRSKEIADVTVDLALAGLQLFLPLDESRHFARTSSRRWSPHRNDVVVFNGTVSAGGLNRSPGLTLDTHTFQAAIRQASKLLESVGNRLNAFLEDPGRLPKLNQAWCDAAYWMHEAFAEPLDTIAVAKLETTIEVLLSASSTKLSTARLRSALKVFNGLSPKDFVFSGSPQTVDTFVQEVVETRSRVLHGTLSTLSEEGAEISLAISSVARDHVLKFTLALDQYILEASATDDVKSFLKWLEMRRAWEWTWP